MISSVVVIPTNWFRLGCEPLGIISPSHFGMNAPYFIFVLCLSGHIYHWDF